MSQTLNLHLTAEETRHLRLALDAGFTPFGQPLPGVLRNILVEAEILERGVANKPAMDMNDPMAAMGQIFKMMEATTEKGDAVDDQNEILHAVALDHTQASELHRAIFSAFGFALMGLGDAAPGPDIRAAAKVEEALRTAFPSLNIPDLSAHQTDSDETDQLEISQTSETALDSDEAVLGIATEMDGDIAGYYIFDQEADAKLNAHDSDAWDFVNSKHAKGVIACNDINDALLEISSRGLKLKEAFGICVY